tara:strand:- start:1088 stop:1393 length:306 start_codon:yes stop_codon:yes gene_type:complete
MEFFIRIQAQIRENYAFLPNGNMNTENPIWKLKGCQYFIVRVDLDHFMDNRDEYIDNFQKILDNESSKGCLEFDYLGHETLSQMDRVLDVSVTSMMKESVT